LVGGWNFERNGQQASQLLGWSALACFDLAQSEHGAASPLRQFFLRQIQLFTTQLEPFVDRGWRIQVIRPFLPVGGRQESDAACFNLADEGGM
jgi:hypothetical protein